MTDISLLVNPAAGRGRAPRVVAEVAERLRAAGSSVSILVGTDAADSLALARRAAVDGADALVALGGDGMAHLVINAVAGTSTPFGIVPTGTGNDLAAALGLPRSDPLAAAGVLTDALATGGGRRIDAVRVGERWYGCVLGAGFDSRVNDRANRMRWPHGQARYTVAMVAELGVFRPIPFRLTIDDQAPWEVEAMLVAVGNAPSYGAGMQICPRAELDDGLLDITVVSTVGKVELLRTFPKIFSGRHAGHPAVTMVRARQIVIEAPEVSAYADGELMAPLPVTCECVPGALRVLA